MLPSTKGYWLPAKPGNEFVGVTFSHSYLRIQAGPGERSYERFHKLQNKEDRQVELSHITSA